MIEMEIPKFELNDIEEVNEALDIINNRKDVHELTLQAIEWGIKNDLDKVYFFDIILKDGHTISVSCNQNKWEESLQNLLEKFEYYEEYEKCAKVFKIQKKLKKKYG
jgi:predicted nucleic acid-binding protein